MFKMKVNYKVIFILVIAIFVCKMTSISAEEKNSIMSDFDKAINYVELEEEQAEKEFYMKGNKWEGSKGDVKFSVEVIKKSYCRATVTYKDKIVKKRFSLGYVSRNVPLDSKKRNWFCSDLSKKIVSKKYGTYYAGLMNFFTIVSKDTLILREFGQDNLSEGQTKEERDFFKNFDGLDEIVLYKVNQGTVSLIKDNNIMRMEKPKVKLERKKNKVTVYIKRRKKNAWYQIYVKKNGKYKKMETTKKRTYSFKFDKKKICRVKVRGVKKKENKRYYSDYVKRTIDTKGRVTSPEKKAQKSFPKHFKNGKIYTGNCGGREFSLCREKGYYLIKIGYKYGGGYDHGYLLKSLEEITGKKEKNVCNSYKVCFEAGTSGGMLYLQGTLIVKKNGKIKLKMMSSIGVWEDTYKPRKKYNITLQ